MYKGLGNVEKSWKYTVCEGLMVKMNRAGLQNEEELYVLFFILVTSRTEEIVFSTSDQPKHYDHRLK